MCILTIDKTPEMWYNVGVKEREVRSMWEIVIHTRDNQKGFIFDKKFNSEKEARQFSSRLGLAWKYNGYCTFQKN